MIKAFFLSFLVCFSTLPMPAQIAQQIVSIQSSSSVPPPTITVDAFVPMNTSSPGTTLSLAILSAGTSWGQGTSSCNNGDAAYCDWNNGTTGGNFTPFTVANAITGCATLGPVQLNGGGALWPVGTTDYGIAVTNANNVTIYLRKDYELATVSRKATIAGCIKMPTTVSSPYDIIGTFDYGGNYAVMQATSATTVAVEVASANSSTITITSGATLWFSMTFDDTSGTVVGTLHLFSSSGAELSGSPVSRSSGSSTQYVNYVNIGNNANTTNSVTVQNLMWDFTNGANPLGPL